MGDLDQRKTGPVLASDTVEPSHSLRSSPLLVPYRYYRKR